MKKLFIVVACLWAFQAPAQGTYRATSCSHTAVSAAITAEQANPVDGDIISIPAGSCTWTSPITITFSNSVTIQGAGAVSSTTGGASTTGSDSTIIIDNTGGNGVFVITTNSPKSFRFTGIDLATNSSSTPEGTGMLTVGGNSTAVRVDHCHIDMTLAASKGIAVVNSVVGVADHNYIAAPSGSTTNGMVFLNGGNWENQVDPNSLGDRSWVDTDHFGTSQFFFVEDSRFSNGWVSDCSNGGRYVIRYSTAINVGGTANHGTHNPWRGCRAAEFYMNTFNDTGNTNGGDIESINSGPALVWGNTTTAFRYVVGVSIVRQDGATYTQTYPPNGWGYCGEMTQQSNGLTEDSPWDGNQSASTGYPCLDSPGRGAGDLLSGYSNVLDVTAGNIITWPHQALDPIYVWDNTYNDAGYSPEGILDDSTSGNLANNRDYYIQFGTHGNPGSFNGTAGVGQGPLSARPSTCTAGPGGNTPGVGYWATDTNTLYVCNPTNTWTVYYKPYTYPHPLTLSSGATVAAPTKLSATVH